VTLDIEISQSMILEQPCIFAIYQQDHLCLVDKNPLA